MGIDENSQIEVNQSQQVSPKLSFSNNTWCLLIAAIQIVGGLVGIFLYFKYFGLEPQSLVLTLVFAPFVYGIYAGVMLWQSKKQGLIHSMVVQLLQIPRITFGIFGFHLYLGAEINIGWFESKYKFYAELGSNSTIYINPSSDLYGINLLALVAFMYLWKLNRKLKPSTTIEEQSILEK